MHSLIKYELDKTWGRRSFALSVCALALINLFLLWFSSLPDESAAPLSAHRMFLTEIRSMTEQEKGAYLESLKETIDGIDFVHNVIMARSISGEMGDILAGQILESSPGTFEKYHPLYQSGSYLHYTDSFYQEKDLVDGWYAEWLKVDGYGSYLRSVQENKEILGGIGIFGDQEKESFSARNIAKSAEAYAKLTDAGIRWTPAKSMVSAMECLWTDLLLLLSAFLFIGIMIFEEKKKQLFYVTRCTRRGILHSMTGKLAALLIHCILVTFLLYGLNLAFYGLAAGFPDLNVPVQSVADYMGSPFSITIGQFLTLSLFTKGLALFASMSVLTALCVPADSVLLPCGLGGALCAVSWLLYLLFPAGTRFSALKYCNPAGIMRTECLYGDYLNFNLGGYPVSRTAAAWGLIFVLSGTGIALSLLLFDKGQSLSLKKRRTVQCFRFRPHGSLLGHELYKIMITDKALVVLLAFLLLMGYSRLTDEYKVSVSEQYYQELMLQLEGPLGPEKEAMILAEQDRFQRAFDEIGRIDQMVSEGLLAESAGEELKARWYAVTAFYPSFRRIWAQYQRILEDQGGFFIYDTGYLYLMGAGTYNNSFTADLMLLSICVTLAFGNCLAMEYRNGAWRLLDAAPRGQRKVFQRKMFLCGTAAALLSLILFLCRLKTIASVFPMGGTGLPVQNIPCCAGFPLRIPAAVFILLAALSQALSLVLVTWGVLLVSRWRKDYVQTLFISAVLFALPLALKLLGIAHAGWFSVYPLYAWTCIFPAGSL